MRKFGLIGYPLGHSFSKKFFADKFHNEHIVDCSYENYPLTDLSKFYELIKAESELTGLNVTIPYKSDIISFLDSISIEAKAIGAVNVIKIKRTEGKLKLSGYNSDIKGIKDSLMPYLSSDVTDALVLGTGGSSRAVCYVLAEYGLHVTLVSRNNKRDSVSYQDIDEKLMEKTSLIINTTPVGMFPDILSRPDINYDLLNSKHILFDLVYNPEITYFLKSGEDKGCQTINGLKMLYSQAERAWEIWNDENM